MEQDTTLVADSGSVAAAIADNQAGGTTDLVEEELLIEEISIDGMCGVY